MFSKIGSKLLCLSDFKTFLSFQFVPAASKEAIDGLCVRGSEEDKRRRRGRSEEMVRRGKLPEAQQFEITAWMNYLLYCLN